MPIYVGNTKQGELYYGGTKIAEAYYGGTKVFSSGGFTPETITFNYTGDVQTWTVPSGVTKLMVDCVGGASYYDAAGGQNSVTTCGGRVNCSMSVSTGQTLYLYVGGLGNCNTTGWNGGGQSTGTDALSLKGASGGGSSDIRIGGTTLNDRKVVAGGAGGAVLGGSGGAGGGLIGGSVSIESCGQGGTQTAGGTGGTAGYNANGTPGTFGTGGTGPNGSGGGGGGWYGGGGGAYIGMYGNGSGGGGSSYTDSTLCTNVVHTQGYSEATGNGWITITTSNG